MMQAGYGHVSAPFIRRPVATLLLALGLAFVGIICYLRLPVSGVPQVDIPTISVWTDMPGANAETMATSVTSPLERALSQIPGLASLTSSSQSGTSEITLEFDLSRNIDAAAFDVQTAINVAASDLPHDLPHPPVFEKGSPSDAKLLTIAIYSDTLPITRVSELAENYLATELARLDGVGQIYYHGLQKPAIRIRVDPAKVASLGISLEDLRRRVAESTANSPKGSLTGARQSLAIDTTDQIVDAATYESLILAFHEGSPVRLRDVATVITGAENSRVGAWVNGHRAVTVEIRKQAGHNVIETVKRIKAELPRLRAELPQAVHLQILGDRTQTIQASVFDLQFSLVLTIVLVVGVIWLFLGDLRATLIPSLAIPLSLLGTFVAMDLLGYSLNNVSLMALTIVIGFVVDDAIVMLENILRHVELGEKPLAAALKGAQEVGFTILSMTFSLVAVFIPLLFMDGLVGRLFREFAITATVAILISCLVSLTLTPMLCARLIDARAAGKISRAQSRSEGFFAWLSRVYAATLARVLAHQRLALIVTAGTLMATIGLYMAIPKGFFPQQDNGMINGVAEAARDISHPALVARMKVLADTVRRDPAVRDVYFYVEGSPAANMGRFLIDLKPLDEREESVYEVIGRLKERTEALAGISMHLQARQDVQLGARVSKTQFQYTLRHSDIGQLERWAPKLSGAMQGISVIEDVNSDLEPNAPQIRIVLDRNSMAQLGVSVQSVDDTLYDAFGQRQIASFNTQTNVYRIVLEADPAYQLDERALDAIHVTSSGGQQVPLRSFATLERTTAPLIINHDGQFPAVTLSFNLAPGHALGEAVDAISEKERLLQRPAGMSAVFQGTARAFRESLETQPMLIAAAILAVYIVLGVLYESAIHPLTIISTLPSAGVGALGALILVDYEFSLIALIGLILLIGIVKKNGIMMLDFALEAERDHGLTPRDAIYQAAVMRFRPIMMTTLAALLGALPLAFGHGAGSELRRPLGITMVGGLLLSQLLTLYTTPVIYLYMSRLSRVFEAGWRRISSAGSAEVAPDGR